MPPATPRDIPTNFRTIQALRAVAAFLVVAYHAFDMWAFRIQSPSADVAWTNGAAGVDIFFIISGFVMVVSSRRLSQQPGAWWTFVRHRLVRIVPLYWLTTTAKLVLVLAFANLALRSNIDPDYVVRSYLFLPVLDGAGHFRPLLSVGWTLTYEFVFYLLFALAIALRLGVTRVLVLGFAAFFVLALLRNDTWPAWTVLFSTVVFEFLFGVVLARAILRGWTLPPAVAGCLVVAGFAAILVAPEGGENLRVVMWGLPALGIVAGAVSLEARIGASLPRWLLAMGDASYSIYLTHGLALPVVGLAVIRLHSTAPAVEVLTVVVCLAVASVLGWLVYVSVERPMTAWLKARAGAGRTRILTIPA